LRFGFIAFCSDFSLHGVHVPHNGLDPDKDLWITNREMEEQMAQREAAMGALISALDEMS